MNQALSVIRSIMRSRLNEPTPGFWKNPVLNMHLQSAYNEYFALFMRKNPEEEHRYVEVVYPGSAKSLAITTSGHLIALITVVEDYTDFNPGVPLGKAQGMEDIVRAGYATDYTTDAGSSKYYFGRIPTVASGVQVLAQTLYLSPLPSTARSLRIHYAAGPQVLSADTYTTGLPDDYEECMIWRAIEIAKIQEGVPPSMLQIVQDQLKRADQAVRTAKGPTRGGDRIVYHDCTQ